MTGTPVTSMSLSDVRKLIDEKHLGEDITDRFTDTDFNDHCGFRTAAEGAEPSVYLATLPEDSPSGIHWGYVWTADGTGGYGVIPW